MLNKKKHDVGACLPQFLPHTSFTYMLYQKMFAFTMNQLCLPIFPEVSTLTKVYGLIVGNTLGNPLDP